MSPQEPLPGDESGVAPLSAAPAPDPVQPRKVPAGHGALWLVGAFYVFKRSPLIWITLLLVYLAIILVGGMIPFFGSLVITLLSPVFAAGLMLACRDVEAGEELELPHLFAGFRNNVGQLIAVGGLYLAGSVIVIILVALLVGIVGGIGLGVSQTLTQQNGGSLDSEAGMALLASGAGLITLLTLALIMPLLMAYWFAPALVALSGLDAVTAMKRSFAACWRNFTAFLVYGLAAFLLLIVAVLPLGLGLLVAFPLLTIANYTAWRDVFCPPGAQGTPSAEPAPDQFPR